MKLTINRKQYSISDIVNKSIDPDGYSYPGQLEFDQEKLKNTVLVLSNLLDKLLDLGILSPSNMLEILGLRPYDFNSDEPLNIRIDE